MGRPRKYPLEDPAAAGEPPGDDEEPQALEPEEVVELALQRRGRLTPEEVRALDQSWRNHALADDEYAKKHNREVVSALRGRTTHVELHPGCTRVTVDVPMLPNKQFVRINERAYVGTVEVWECEARTILSLVHHARLVEAARLTDNGGGGFLDLDSPLAERARAIQRA